MSRYEQWRRLEGPTAERPDLFDFGKKLLAYLDNQRQLSGVQTQSIERVLPDGSVVRARFDGDLPCIEVKAASPSSSNELIPILLHGIVTKPRRFGTGAANDGQNVFGDFAHNILVNPPVSDDPVHQRKWKTLFYDSTYVPVDVDNPPQVDGFYAHAPHNRPLFIDGLVHHGNIDWKNGDGASVNWCGRTTRSIPDSEGYERSVIFHNGAVLFDHSTIDFSTDILGACLRNYGGKTYLIYATSGGGYKFHRIEVKPDFITTPWIPHDTPAMLAPRLTADATTYTLLDTIVGGTDFVYSDWIPVVSFNQSATEARFIVPDVLGAMDSSTDVVRYTEFIVDLAKPTIVETTHSVGMTVDVDFPYTKTFTARLTPNLVNIAKPFLSWSPTGGGGYTRIDDSRYDTAPAYRGTTDAPWTLVDRSTSSWTKPASAEFPIAVDYQDDVPVYLFYKDPAIEHTTAWALDISETVDAHADSTATWPDGGSETAGDENLYGSRVMTRIGALPQTDNPALAVSFSMTGGYVRAVDKDGVEWLRSTIEGDGSGTEFVDASYDFSGERHESALGVITQSRTASCSITQSASSTGRVKRPQLWFVDLRSRSATWTEWDCTRTNTSSYSYSGTGDSATESGFLYIPEPPTNGTQSTGQGYDESIGVRTRVMFDGVVVDDRSTTLSDSSHPAASTSSVMVTWVAERAIPGTVQADQTLLQELAAPITDGGDGSTTTGSPSAQQYAASIAWTSPATGDGTAGWGSPYDLLQNEAITWSQSFDGHDLFIRTDHLLRTPHVTYSTWMGSEADVEPSTTELYARSYGTWICHQGQWAFSMCDMGRADISTPGYAFGIRVADGDDTTLQTLTGNRGAELFEPFWPLSRFLYTLK